MGFSPGISRVSDLSDVVLNNPGSDQVFSYDGTTAKWKNSTNAPEVVVRWNATNNTWAARPAAAPFGVIFLSTNDPDATAPTDANKKIGDLWRRHPDAT